MCGDFNNPSINWFAQIGDREVTRLINFVEDMFLCQRVDKDLYTCEGREPFASSDHNIIRCALDVKVHSKENLHLIPKFYRI